MVQHFSSACRRLFCKRLLSNGCVYTPQTSCLRRYAILRFRILPLFFKKWMFPASFSTVKNTKFVNYTILPMTGFEPRTDGIRSDHCANWSPTTARRRFPFESLTIKIYSIAFEKPRLSKAILNSRGNIIGGIKTLWGSRGKQIIHFYYPNVPLCSVTRFGYFQKIQASFLLFKWASTYAQWPDLVIFEKIQA